MFVSRALGQCAQAHRARCAVQSIRWRPVHLLTLQSTTSRSVRVQSWLSRQQSARYATGRGPSYLYPENLNVFNSGAAPAVAAGTIRIVCLVVLGLSSFYVAPNVYADDAAPWYWTPLIAVGGAMPLIATGIAFGGYVHHINLLLPRTARKSHHDLKRFIANMPPNSIVQVKSMWFWPWPKTRQIYFEDFRRLPVSKWRLSNLESVPKRNFEEAEKNSMGYWMATKIWIAKKVMGTYCVNNNLSRDLSRVPGLWKKIWPQIPMSGARTALIRESMEKAPVLASNRPVLSSQKPQVPSERVVERRSTTSLNSHAPRSGQKAAQSKPTP